ncbi:hypothetical protein [Membranihabitans maritimus]|uniref:hypothetical protein n=1 Tax=Membranihabitans maritimus TaxID=2904244 RepID=UPI001F416FFF|nr:hypothetical protein [Membranihabitans maritimus]
MKKESEILREMSDAQKQFSKDSRIKSCYHYDNDNCGDKIIQAHSLQRNGVLSLVESDVNGNQKVLCFKNPTVNGFGQYIGLTPIGKKNASTFFGFCSVHDKGVFQPIEDQEIDISSDEHCFLLIYRGAAKEYHQKIEELKGFKENDRFNSPGMEFEQTSRVIGTETAIREAEDVKKILNEILKNRDFSKLDYLTQTMNYCIPIACSATLTPKHYLSDELFNHSEDHNDKYEPIFLTVIPRENKTHILYSCLPEHKKAQKFIDELKALNEQTFQAVTSSLLIGNVHNTFLSPQLFGNLTEEEQTTIVEAIELTDKVGVMIHRFYHIGINLFDKKNEKK